MSSLTREKFAPYLLAFSAAIFWYMLEIELPNEHDVLGASLTLGAILTGFLATAKAIIVATDSPTMQRIRSTDYLTDLVSYLKEAIWCSFAYCIISLIGFFNLESNQIYGTFWIFLGFCSAGTFIRFTNILFKVIESS